MAVFSVSIAFVVDAKDHDKAEAKAKRIGAYVVQDKMATEATIVDIELLEDDEPLDDIDDEIEDYE